MFTETDARPSSLHLFGAPTDGSPMSEPTDPTGPATAAPPRTRRSRATPAAEQQGNVARLHPGLLQAMRNLDKGLDAVSIAETLTDILRRMSEADHMEEDLPHAMEAVHFILSRGRDEAFAAHEAICKAFGMRYTDLQREEPDAG